jgi:hypothetical protein
MKLFLGLIMLVLLFVPISVLGQKTQRVKFAKGAISVTVIGRLNNYDSKAVFIIRVKKGQTLTVQQIKANNSNYVTLIITSPSGEDVTDAEANCNSNKTIESTAVGDYQVSVTECMKADAWSGNFKLKFTVK